MIVTETIRKHRVYRRNVYHTKQSIAECRLNGMSLFDIVWSLASSHNTREDADKEVAQLNKLMADNGSKTYFAVHSWTEDQVVTYNTTFLCDPMAA